MSFRTADLCDAHAPNLQIAEPVFARFGKHVAFSGRIETIKTFEDNTLVRAALEQSGAGKVLVVDGGGSRCCALLGDILASLAIKNGWTGIVVNGCIRDAVDIDDMAIGVRALATHPLKSAKNNYGERNVPVTFAGVTFRPGEFIYADADGVVLSAVQLKL